MRRYISLIHIIGGCSVDSRTPNECLENITYCNFIKINYYSCYNLLNIIRLYFMSVVNVKSKSLQDVWPQERFKCVHSRYMVNVGT